jgi:hypothetical protein
MVVASCTATDSTGVAPGTSVAFTPSFQVEPDDFDAQPIDRIRLTARDAESGELVGASDDEVSPDVAAWTLSLTIDMNGATGRSVVVEVELLGGASVQWSGRLGPIEVSPDVFNGPQYQIPVFRGPLDNLEVDSVTIDTAPTQLLVGQSGSATATIRLLSGSMAEPELFWVSLDDSIASVVVDSAGVATITAIAPGTATIAAAAGPEFDEVDVEVLPRVGSVLVAPAVATIAGVGGTVSLTATVFDGLGIPAPSEPIVWSMRCRRKRGSWCSTSRRRPCRRQKPKRSLPP